MYTRLFLAELCLVPLKPPKPCYFLLIPVLSIPVCATLQDLRSQAGACSECQG